MKNLPIYILVAAGAVICLVPFAWTVSTAFKTRQQGYAVPPQWIPTTPRLQIDGKQVPVAVVGDPIKAPAAVVRIRSSSSTTAPAARELIRTIPVEASALVREGDVLKVKLPAAPKPVRAELVKDMPQGVAQVRTYPDGEAPSEELFVAPAELQYAFDPQFRNFFPPNPSDVRQRKEAAWTALPLSFEFFVLNTFTITIISIIGQVLSCSLVAYGFARFRFSGRQVLFLLLLSTMMLPSQVTMIPVFLIWNKVGAIDTFAPLTIPAFFAQNAFFVFLLRQFFLQIPRELDEAAMMDGCGPLRIWWTVILPLSKPALTTVAVLAFIGHWDDFFGPLIYLNSMENYTVSLALRLFQDQNGTEFHLLMAAALLHIIPVVILFFVAQRYFVKGIAMTGMKA